MIIEFLGCPRSGKTTTAARVFANLKEAGFNCEFIPEQARFYIAQKRVSLDLEPTKSLTLDDIDQMNIFNKQYDAQELMLKACGKDALIVTDSSILNSLLYMTDTGIQDESIFNLVQEHITKDRVTFYSTPVEWVGGLDPNRVHSKEQSDTIDKRIKEWLIPNTVITAHSLLGDADSRWRMATSEVIRRILAK